MATMKKAIFLENLTKLTNFELPAIGYSFNILHRCYFKLFVFV